MKGKYGRVTDQIIKELTTIVGRDNISTKEHEIEGYSYDGMPLAKPYAPQVIIKPTDTRSIAKLLDFANKKRIPVTPRGGGTGLNGGCVPIYREIPYH